MGWPFRFRDFSTPIKKGEWVEGNVEQTVIDVDLNENDLLVLSTEKTLTVDQRKWLTEHLELMVKDKGKKAMVLDGDFKITVIHRA